MNAYTEIMKAGERPVVSANKQEDLKKLGMKQLHTDLLLVSNEAKKYFTEGIIRMEMTSRLNSFLMGYFLMYHPWSRAYMGVSEADYKALVEAAVVIRPIVTKVFQAETAPLKPTTTQKLHAYVNSLV